ncbi:ParB N-terminal domain-containing protein [candidate division KSB1 bacterium]|nr:ParB N-terminal domain-containing protein [candidate division KSB1 bacterium]
MKAAIDSIVVKERIRQNTGDLTELMQSIQAVGLIQPLTISENHVLISGYRRLEACKRLGWEQIDVRVLPIATDPLKQLDVELEENRGRSDLREEDWDAFRKKREELLRPQHGNLFTRWLSSVHRWLVRFWHRLFGRRN